MKPLQIISLVVIAIAIGAIIVFSQDYTTYASFSGAKNQEGSAEYVSPEFFIPKNKYGIEDKSDGEEETSCVSIANTFDPCLKIVFRKVGSIKNESGLNPWYT